MSKPTNKRSYNATKNTTAANLMANRDSILALWVHRVKQSIPAAKAEQDPIIVDTIPAFLENLAQALDQTFPRSLATEGTTVAAEHGGERARMTRFPPGEVIREFQILRDVVLEVLSNKKNLDHHETSVVIKSVDQAMSESLTAYFLVHQGIREQFTAMLTHDLRNPLTAIKAATDLMMRRPDQAELTHLLIPRIAENTRRIDQMIQDLLDASKIQFGDQLHFEVEKCELYTLIQGTLAHLAMIHGERFVFHGKPTCGYWNADAFKRAVENLVTNAVKYGDSSKPIMVLLEELRGRAIVSVRNEGSYISPEDQETLFHSFMRTQSAQAGKKRGWGLGLAMVRGMAEGHGGSIAVDSSPERGTTFTIDVPLDARTHGKHPLTPGT